jgi:hypothetical protein
VARLAVQHGCGVGAVGATCVARPCQDYELLQHTI